jgi:hypothetical protein
MWKYVIVAAIILFLLWAADPLSIFSSRVHLPRPTHRPIRFLQRSKRLAHRDAFRTVPTSPAGATALIAYACECAERDGGWETAMGDYRALSAEGKLEHEGNNVAELLGTLTEFLRASDQVVA